MKPDRAREAIAAGAQELGVAVSPEATEAILLHLEMVLAAAKGMNLTSIDTLDAAVRLHVLDSLSAAPLLEGCKTLADLGSGAGYPGIPLSLASGRPVCLVESRARRAEFLRGVASRLAPGGFDVSVVRGRAEEAGAIAESGRVDGVVARAVASLPVLAELAAPYIREGGRFVAMKGAPERDEIERGDTAAEIVGLRRTAEEELTIPGGSERRALIVYTRIGEPSIALPRRVGLASNRPLA